MVKINHHSVHNTLFLVLILLVESSVYAQKKPISPEDYDTWNKITGYQISPFGSFVSYTSKPYKGNQDLFVYDRRKDSTYIFERVASSKLGYNEKYVVFKRVNDYDTIRRLKLDDIPKKKWPKDTVDIFLFQKDSLIRFPNSNQFKVAEKGGEIVAIKRGKSFKTPQSNSIKKKKKCLFFKKKTISPSIKFKGDVYTIFSSNILKDTSIEGISELTASKYNDQWVYVQNKEVADSIDSVKVVLMNEKLSPKVIYAANGYVKNISWDEQGEHLSFLFSSDTGEVKKWELKLYQNNTLSTLLDTNYVFENNYYGLSTNKIPYFSKNGNRLFFGVSKKETKQPEDTLTEEEKYHLDLWSWTDRKLQPQQLKELSRQKKRTDLWVLNLEDKKVLKLTDSTISRITIPNHQNSKYALLASQHPYLKEMTWDGWYFDYYRFNLSTGEKVKILTRQSGSVILSPKGDKLVYFSSTDSLWHLRDFNMETERKLKAPQIKFYRRNHDTPDNVYSAGLPFWLENEEAVVLKSQYDYWVFPLKGGKPYRLTNGKERNTIYQLLELDPNQVYYSLKNPIYFKTFNTHTKKEGVAKYGNNGIEKVFEEPYKITLIEKADSSNYVILRQMSVSQYPEIQLMDLSFTKRKVISNTNPQQDSLNWATVELIDWRDYKGDSVSGLLYKPEDFNPNKKYPLLVYFYERYSDNYHYFYSPKPTASIIYPTEYASNGYIVFIPDISYEIGHPAKSAYNSIMSGVDFLLKTHPYIDSTRMGLQGQSWGGYQTAQLITMTNRFAAAMAGAPVSNMFSAYGGIRWGSGHNRAFQYEKGQSRIGATIWEKPELYIENSPIFHVPNIQTPLLIMHNDGDGAVPWYQGIELFTAMRRLNKPVWMLNYNNDAHNLMKEANRRDLSIRMKQFFDFYLQNKPMPYWMKYGIPALNKGIKTGYETQK